MKILLINPPAGSIYYVLRLKTPPLGLAYIAAVLKQAHHQVKIIDLNVESKDYRTLPYSDFDLVGISVDTMRYPISLKIAQAANKKVWWWQVASMSPSSIPKLCPLVCLTLWSEEKANTLCWI